VIKLLVVDDSALARKLLGKVFAEQGDFEVRFARDGLEALAQLSPFAPDVVTLDIHMPGMDGLACLDRIMLERPCPVVMVSSLTAEGAEATLEALRLGAVDFVAKPQGAVSLSIDDLGAELVAKVRCAATARVRLVSRLRERVRHRIGAPAPDAAPIAPVARRHRKAGSTTFGVQIVVIGVSTGGPPALEAVLRPLPATFPCPIIIAQHMPASFTGALARRLDGICQIGVTETGGPQALEPGHAYIGRGDADVVIAMRAGRLAVMSVPARPAYPWRPSVDRLVRSAMDHLASDRIVGVLMTGMGDDGAQAMSLLHTQGGRTIAESMETAVIWGMPGELVSGSEDRRAPAQDGGLSMPLVRRDPPAAQPAAGPVPALERLSSGDAEARWSAARTLGAGASAQEIAALGAALARETDPRQREAILTALARADVAEAVDAVLPDLRSDDSGRRAGALDALRAMPRAVGARIADLVRDGDADVRILACELLRQVPVPQAESLICERLDVETNANVVAAALEVLAEIPTTGALPVLARCAERFSDQAFLVFSIEVTADLIRSRAPPPRA
jgi:two-component system chemotaxis response regulator CheB